MRTKEDVLQDEEEHVLLIPIVDKDAIKKDNHLPPLHFETEGEKFNFMAELNGIIWDKYIEEVLNEK